MIVFDLENRPLIHCNSNGRRKEYRHAEQATEWLSRKFAITNALIDHTLP